MKVLQSTAEDRALITSEEGRVTFVYDDAFSPPRKYIRGTKIKGNLTAGVGHLLSKGKRIFPEAEEWIGKTIPANVIDHWLDVDLDEAEAAVANLVKVQLAPHERGTLYSFTFNVGVDAFAHSGVLRAINGNDLERVPRELAKWNKTTINGVKVTSNGLIKRRALETAYWLSGKAPAAGVNKNVPQATEIAEVAPKGWSPTELVSGGGVVATLATAGFSAQGVLAYTFAGLLVVAVLVLGAIAIKRYFFRS